jgi:hypothetical protein
VSAMRITPELTWREVVARALKEMGGFGHLREIYNKVEGHRKCEANSRWKCTIRRVLRENGVFVPVPPHGSGLYRLKFDPFQSAQYADRSCPADIDHGEAQGMLLKLGQLYGYETYVAARDRSSRVFEGSPLGSYATVSSLRESLGGMTYRRIAEIDVMWLAEDFHGLYPKYAFEVEHSTGIAAGLDRLLKIPDRCCTRLHIVAPTESDKLHFRDLLQQAPYRPFAGRFRFCSYDNLGRLYELAAAHSKLKSELRLALNIDG